MRLLECIMRGPIIQEFECDLKNWHGGIAYLDRDGVLNYGSPNYINSPDELQIIPNSADAIAKLRALGFKIVIVTNQSAIMRGLWDEKRLESIHQKLVEEIGNVDLIITCPHRTRDGCNCRKPRPGMLFAGSEKIRGQSHKTVNWFGEKPIPIHELDLMVGDRNSDMGAGWAVGARLFQVNESLGLPSVIERICNGENGDEFSPV